MKFVKYYEAIEKDFNMEIYTTPNNLVIYNESEKHTIKLTDLGILKRYNINFYKYFLDLRSKKHINAIRYVKKEKVFSKFLKLYIENRLKALDYLKTLSRFKNSTLLDKYYSLEETIVSYDYFNIKEQFLETYFKVDLDLFNSLLDIERKDLK